MANIIPFTPADLVTQSVKQQNKAAAGGFDALLASSDQTQGFIDNFLDNMMGSLNSGSGITGLQDNYGNPFGFSAAFESTFGLSGPLPSFISMITSKLHLNAAQNQAFQDIAINNKDATKTPASIQKIAFELKQAGIGIQV